MAAADCIECDEVAYPLDRCNCCSVPVHRTCCDAAEDSE